MRIEALKYRTEEKMDIIIYVDFYFDCSTKPVNWKIGDIAYKMSRRKKYTYLSENFSDDYEYRGMELRERREYALKKFYEFVGKEKIQEALISAWESLKPDIENIDIYNFL